MSDRYDELREKTKRIVAEGLKLAKEPEKLDLCQPKCASCLAAEARGNVDERDYKGGFSSSEDVCLLDARDILAEKLKWQIL